MKKIFFSQKSIPLAFLVLGLLSFAPLIPRLGLYWDDWPSLWFLHFFGPEVFPDVFTIDRPTQGWLFVLTTSLMGESLIVWQLFGIFTRWLSCVGLWWVLRLLWPRRLLEVTWIVFLFMIYPGFNQQYIPITYSHMYIMLSIFMLSMGTMILSYSDKRHFWTFILLSLFTAAGTMFTLEYFVGLELLRPVFLFMISSRETDQLGKRITLSIKRWIPYLAILFLFFYWRITNETPRGNITLFEDFKSAPTTTVFDLIKTVLEDIFESGILAWGRTILPGFILTYRTAITFAILLIVVLSAVFVILYMLRLKVENVGSSTEKEGRIRWEYQAVLLGIYSLLIAGWPIWATNLKIDLFFPWDRFTLMMMLGACLLAVGVVFRITRNRLANTIILGLLIGLSVGLHFQTGLDYMREWNFQKTFFWQLVWRAPGIQPGTALLTSKLPFQFTTDNSLTAPLNWTYAPENYSRQMPYGFLNIDARLGKTLRNLELNTPIHQPYRATDFYGSTSKAILFYYSPEICLKIIDPEADRFWPYKPGYVPEAIQLSDPSLIIPNPVSPAYPPEQIFGMEPLHDWCYYFEKAELARQQKKWGEVAANADKALKLSQTFNKKNVSELITFIEGYAHTGKWEDAANLTFTADKNSDIIRDSLCATWRDLSIATTANQAKTEALSKINEELNCNIP